MTKIRLQIDGKQITAAEGTTILDAARSEGISIPTLCHHDKLMPFGACRLCIVEVERGDSKNLVISCAVPVEEGSVVKTRSEKIDRLRKSLLELMLAHAPHSPVLQELAREYRADRDRFEKEADFCIHCGLCVRYCAEVKQAHAIGFIDRGARKEICFIPEIASRECGPCKECFPLCPTSYLQAMFVLGESLAFPRTVG
jgi:NADH dehydrogenase/NADH:ubiquinone oxidoreductase subunit G